MEYIEACAKRDGDRYTNKLAALTITEDITQIIGTSHPDELTGQQVNEIINSF